MEAMLTMPPRAAASFGFAAARDAHRAREVDVDDVGEHVGVVLQVAADDARGVDEDVEPVEALHDCRDRLRIADVENLERDRCILVRGGGTRPFAFGCAGGDDACAKSREGASATESDAARSACDEGGPAGK